MTKLNYFFNLLILCNILLPLKSAYAGKSNDSIDMDIETLTYNRPKSGIGISGELVFNSLDFYRGGMYLQLNNKNTIFNSNIFIRPGFVGFTGPHTSLGFSVEEDSPLKTLQKMTMKKSQILINDRFFQLAGAGFTYQDLTTEIKLENFGYYCKGHPNYNSTDAEGIIAGCLLYSKVSPSKEKKKKGEVLNLYYKSTDKTGSTILSGKVKEIEIKSDNIHMNIPKFTLDVGSFEILGQKLKLNCQKDPDLTTLNSDPLINNCLEGVSITSPVLKISDKAEDSNFLFDTEHLEIANKKLKFTSNGFKIFDKEGETEISKLKINCAMKSNDSLFDVHAFINECIDEGDISMRRVYYQEFVQNPALLASYQKMIAPEALNQDNKNEVKPEETGIKNMRLKISDHYFKFTAKVKIWPTYYSIGASGVIERGPNNEIIIDIRKTKLPMWITSKSIFLYYFKKYMVSKTVQVKNDKIYILI